VLQRDPEKVEGLRNKVRREMVIKGSLPNDRVPRAYIARHLDLSFALHEAEQALLVAGV